MVCYFFFLWTISWNKFSRTLSCKWLRNSEYDYHAEQIHFLALQPLFSMPYNMLQSSSIFSLQNHTSVLLALSVFEVFHSQIISRFTGVVIRFIADNRKTSVAFLFITATAHFFVAFCMYAHTVVFLSCHATYCLQIVQIPQIWWEFTGYPTLYYNFPKKLSTIIIGSLFA